MNSSMGMVRLPEELWATTCARAASITEFQSPSGSQWATEPHTVPRLRTSGSEIQGAADATTPTDPASADRTMSLWRARGANAKGPVVTVHIGEAPDPVDINQMGGRGQAKLHHGDETLPSGQHSSVVSQLGQCRQGTFQGVGRLVLKYRWIHTCLYLLTKGLLSSDLA